jgi:hypothetical protein
MSFSKSVLLAAGLAIGSVTVALAQPVAPGAAGQTDEVNIYDKTGFMVDPLSGKTVPVGTKTKRVNAKGHAMIMKHAKKLPPGTVIYRSGGDMYMLDGKALEQDTGQKLTDHAKGWTDSE